MGHDRTGPKITVGFKGKLCAQGTIHHGFMPPFNRHTDRTSETYRGHRRQQVFILTSIMGVAYSKGLSKDSCWSYPDAVIPVVKHFAAHRSPLSGFNTASFVEYGRREMIGKQFVPFTAAFELGGARDVIMFAFCSLLSTRSSYYLVLRAYNDIGGVPSAVSKSSFVRVLCHYLIT
jgi:hypothetical protein